MLRVSSAQCTVLLSPSVCSSLSFDSPYACVTTLAKAAFSSPPITALSSAFTNHVLLSLHVIMSIPVPSHCIPRNHLAKNDSSRTEVDSSVQMSGASKHRWITHLRRAVISADLFISAWSCWLFVPVRKDRPCCHTIQLFPIPSTLSPGVTQMDVIWRLDIDWDISAHPYRRQALESRITPGPDPTGIRNAIIHSRITFVRDSPRPRACAFSCGYVDMFLYTCL